MTINWYNSHCLILKERILVGCFSVVVNMILAPRYYILKFKNVEAIFGRLIQYLNKIDNGPLLAICFKKYTARLILINLYESNLPRNFILLRGRGMRYWQ